MTAHEFECLLGQSEKVRIHLFESSLITSQSSTGLTLNSRDLKKREICLLFECFGFCFLSIKEKWH